MRITSSYKGQANYSTVHIACEQSWMVEETYNDEGISNTNWNIHTEAHPV